jgi:hypothetical protein
MTLPYTLRESKGKCIILADVNLTILVDYVCHPPDEEDQEQLYQIHENISWSDEAHTVYQHGQTLDEAMEEAHRLAMWHYRKNFSTFELSDLTRFSKEKKE